MDARRISPLMGRCLSVHTDRWIDLANGMIVCTEKEKAFPDHMHEGESVCVSRLPMNYTDTITASFVVQVLSTKQTSTDRAFAPSITKTFNELAVFLFTSGVE